MKGRSKMKIEKEVITIDSSSENESVGNNQKREEYEINNRFLGNRAGSNGDGSEYVYRTKAEEYGLPSDLSKFPELAVTFAAEANTKRNRRKNKIKKMKKKLTFPNVFDRGENIDVLVAAAPVMASRNELVQDFLADNTENPKIDDAIRATQVMAVQDSQSVDLLTEIDLCLSSSKEEEYTADKGHSGVSSRVILTEVTLKENDSSKEDRISHVDNGEGQTDANEDAEMGIKIEIEHTDKTENLVLQKLLRAPRYFDPVKGDYVTCERCGEDNHDAAECNVKKKKKKKPCFICGAFGHNGKHCKKAKKCSLCQKIGHPAKACTQSDTVHNESSKFCLQCGDLGHDMFSCSNVYCSDDLEKIQCYICKAFGHLCCHDYSNEKTRQICCYNCGHSGHSGPACTKMLHEDVNESQSASKQEEAGEIGDKSTQQEIPKKSSAARKRKKNRQKETINETRRWPTRIMSGWGSFQPQPQFYFTPRSNVWLSPAAAAQRIEQFRNFHASGQVPTQDPKQTSGSGSGNH